MKMGCAATSIQNTKERKSQCIIPKITIGKKIIRGKNNDQVKVVFIFGGPGSKKGRIVDELLEIYGFKLIDVEDLILIHLNRHCGEENEQISNIFIENGYFEKVKRIEHVLQANEERLTLKLILEMVNKELKIAEESGFRLCLIDFLPKLAFVLKTEIFSKKCSEEMNEFQQKWPEVFALNLASPKEEESNSNNTPLLNTFLIEGKKDIIENEASLLIELLDEKDQRKTIKRNEKYFENSKEFINYFKVNDLLATVDISCGIGEAISASVAVLFNKLGFKSIFRIDEKLTVFYLKKGLHQDDNGSHYSSLDAIKNGRFGTLLNRWSNSVHKVKNCDFLVVEVDDLNAVEDASKEVVFLHLIEPDLNCKTTDLEKNRFPFKAFSLKENHVCFFPDFLEKEDCAKMWRSRENSFKKLK